MASKLSVFAALFVCFLVLADASFRVTTTVMEDEENPQQRQQCQQQLQRQRFQSCQRYLSSQQQQRGRGDRWDDEVIEMNPQRGQQSVNQCCQELQQVNRECRCQALQEIERMTQQQQQGGRWSGSSYGDQQQRVRQQVRQLPQMCRIQVPQQCQQRN